MRTTKLFFMAALALMTAACSNDDNDLAIQQPQKAEGITITATLAPKTNGTTRSIKDNTTYIEAKWAVNEHIAVLYTKDATQYAADATVTAVDGTTGAATITFTVESGTADDTPCTLVYPASAAKDDHTGVKDAATLLGAQDGTLSANLDVRVGAGTIQTTTPGLTVTTQPEAQYAIFKFKTSIYDGNILLDVKSLTVTIGSQDYVITLASAENELYAALPPISGQTVTFTAKDPYNKTYTASKDNVTFTAGKYYQTKIKLTEFVPTVLTLDNYSTSWADGKTYVVPAGGLTISDAVSVSGNVTLTMTDGTTLTLNKGISLASGATLTVEGTGTMNINGSNTSTASTVAGSGTLVLTSGTLTATGGRGGDLKANGAVNDCHAGNGGAAISGNVTVNSGGTLTRTNGSNGSYTGDTGGSGSSAGTGGAAVAGTVTNNGGTVN